MDFPFARAAAPLLEVVDSIGSTNAELAARQRRSPQPHGTALLTLDQTAGRGRLDRIWVAPRGTALAVSVVVAADLAPSVLPWLPVIGGLAARDAVADALAGAQLAGAQPAGVPSAGPIAPSVLMKWPNDVLITGVDGVERKVAGVLAEVVAPSNAVVLGVGVNTSMRRDELPVPTATSIAAELDGELGGEIGVEIGAATALADRVAAAVLSGILRRVAALIDAAGDPIGSGLVAEAHDRCGTLGRRVRMSLPGGDSLVGVATALDASGALEIMSADGVTRAVHAGDVTHLRYE